MILELKGIYKISSMQVDWGNNYAPNYEIQISNLLNDPESFDDVVSLLENDEFPLKAEFVKVREYMQKLIDEKETVGDDLFDMFL